MAQAASVLQSGKVREVAVKRSMVKYATVRFVDGPAGEREVQVPIRGNPNNAETIPHRYFSLDKHGNRHLYIARTAIADPGDIIKADHKGMHFGE